MRSREFVDGSGCVWRVWSTAPSDRSLLSMEFAQGWLTFDCGSALRRLAPIPDDWERLQAGQLEYLCLCATEMPRRTGPIARMERPGASEQPRV